MIMFISFVSVCFATKNQYMVVKGLITYCHRNYPSLPCMQMNVIEGELTMEMFANNVTSYLNDGWVVTGGIVVDRPWVYQALIKNS
jgi:hypothetical protein